MTISSTMRSSNYPSLLNSAEVIEACESADHWQSDSTDFNYYHLMRLALFAIQRATPKELERLDPCKVLAEDIKMNADKLQAIADLKTRERAGEEIMFVEYKKLFDSF